MSDKSMVLAATRERMLLIANRIRFIQSELSILMIEIIGLQAQLGGKPATTAEGEGEGK